MVGIPSPATMIRASSIIESLFDRKVLEILLLSYLIGFKIVAKSILHSTPLVSGIHPNEREKSFTTKFPLCFNVFK